MAGVVAIDLPGGTAFVEALQRVWGDGDAAFVLDRRLPAAAREELLHQMQPTAILDTDGQRALDGDPTADGDALVVPTSGSSGPPKGVVLTHAAVAAAADASSDALEIDSADMWLACLPLAHIGGLGVVTRALHRGTPLIVHDGFEAARVVAAAQSGATAVSLVPTVLSRIDPTLFRIILLGGSRPPTDRPANAVATYGQTETCGGIVYDGRPLPGIDVRLAPDGEVMVASPTALRCYRGRNAPAAPINHGWLATGDIGEWLPDGRLSVRGRRGDMIITGGENVWPERVEDALAGHPAIAQLAVAGIDDPEWGQRVAVFVVPRDQHHPPTLADLRAMCKATLPAFAAPTVLRLVSFIPRTALGKVRRAELVSGAPPEH